MRHFKDIIVRKRPLPSAVETDDSSETQRVSETSDLDAVRARRQLREVAQGKTLGKPADPPSEDATNPSDAATIPSPSKQIWDIKEDDQEDDSVQRSQGSARLVPADKFEGVTPVPPARTEPDQPAVADPAPTRANRVKTRIIGFHSGAENDVFAARRAEPSTQGQFPAGWLVVVDGPGRGASFMICAGVSTIGRGADQTVCLDFGDTSVSRESHASIAYDEEQNQFFVGHGGKSNIVRKNGNPVLATEGLADADLIRIGKTTLRFVALCGSEFTWGSMEDGEGTDAPES
ncbi:FHA domain-containing protein [Aliiroseovarius sp. KMU-50]|uniref:FHA domain-containing protein n=1 Tax=Aliiroseovarius salicola TaxID=3009082 RepID=A0ABT4VXE4_9RHOB|nr:FHA domain-containing protein [Aliiroseovarius sp. KMU-50]MDA5092854.1 FHA domain-containing protein [Aliiroseovarius sp. KMU-50]